MAEADNTPVDAGTAPADLTTLEKDIIRQVEYYFGDANLSRDKFLQEQIGKDEGWVELSVLLTFKRLAALSEDPKVIVDAVDKSDEGLVQVHEGRTKIRRHPERPLPEQNEETRKEQFERTLYVKGFPLDTTIEQLLDHFKPFEKVVNVAMRKFHDKASKTYKFKGSVFVTFATKDQATDFMAKERAEFQGGTELIRKWRNDYMAEKKEEHANRSNKRKGKKDAAEEEETTFTLPTGTLLKLENIVKETTRESIKAKMAELGGDVSYVEFNSGDEVAVVRMKEQDAAKEVFAKIEEGKFTLDSAEVKVSLVEGEEEKTLLEKAIESMKARRSNQRSNRGGGRGNRGFGKYQQNNRKRGGSPVGGGGDDAPPPAKTTAVAAGDA